jgi:hypothetical protein
LPAVEPAAESTPNAASADLIAPPASPDPGSSSQPTDPGQLDGAVLGETANRMTNVVEPSAADAVEGANTFGFPLILIAAVLLILVARRSRDNRREES